jgi:hypothetical protein
MTQLWVNRPKARANFGSMSVGFLTAGMTKSDPTKDPEFKRVLGNLLRAPPKPHSEMKLGKRTEKKKASLKKGRPRRAD